MPRTDWSELEEHLAKVPVETEMIQGWLANPEDFVRDVAELAKAAYSEGYDDGLYESAEAIELLGLKKYSDIVGEE